MTAILAEATDVGFDYGEFSEQEAADLRGLADQVNTKRRLAAEGIIEFGRYVKAANDIFATSGRNGRFSAWLRDECAMSRSSAYAAMQAFERFGGEPCIGNFAPQALLELSKKQVEASAVSAAIADASEGSKITLERARELISKHAPHQHPKPKHSDKPSIKPKAGGNGAKPFEIGDKCNVCEADAWFRKDDDSMTCSVCNQPYGEPAGDVDEESPEPKDKRSTNQVAYEWLQGIETEIGAIARKIEDVRKLLGRVSDEYAVARHGLSKSLEAVESWRESLA